MDRKTVEMCFLVRQAYISATFWTLDSTCKDEKDHPDCYQRKVQKPASVMVWEYIRAHDMGDLHICEDTIDTALMLEFWRDICCHQDDNFPQELHVHFSRTMQGLILHKFTTAWLIRHGVRVLDGPACSPDLSPIENVRCIMKRRIRKRQPRLLSSSSRVNTIHAKNL